MLLLLRFAFWVAAIGAFTLAVLPHPPILPHEPSDKIQHIAAFLVLASLGTAAYPRTGLARIFLGLAALGAAIELAQLIPALHRDAEWLDWLADMGAACAVLGLVFAWRSRWARR